MQVLSAPLIAIAAFAAFEPDTMTAAVLVVALLLGFVAQQHDFKGPTAGVAIVGFAIVAAANVRRGHPERENRCGSARVGDIVVRTPVHRR